MQPWLQTASGRRFDLCDPTPDMVDFEVDVPEALARIPRFTGHGRAGPYSVAQHSVLGAEAILRETGDRGAARAFLLHDAHEAYIGDIATPIGLALAEIAAREFTLSSGVDLAFVVRTSLKALKRRLDAAIYAAEGIPWPLPGEIAARITEYDLRMLRTERDALLGMRWDWGPEIEMARPIGLGPIHVWPWNLAAETFRVWLADSRDGFPDALSRHARQAMEA